MNRIDLSKLPAPKLIEEIDYEVIVSEMRAKMRELCPEWSGYELESDPANKIIEVASYREMLIRQRVNEAARGVMVAFATGSDLDHLAAFYPEERLEGASATFAARIGLAAALDVDVTIPAGYTVVAGDNKVEARLMHDLYIPSGETAGTCAFEITRPAGAEGNGFSLSWNAITPLPFVTSVEQLDTSHGGSDRESDDDFRRRIPMALERFSTSGPEGAYKAWSLKADERVKDVSVTTPEPGEVVLYLLSKDGDGSADATMIDRVYAILSDERVRPLTDHLTVHPVEIVRYEVRLNVILYAGVAGHEPLMEAHRRLEAKVKALHGVGLDVERSAIVAAAHVEGVKTVELISPAEDIRITESQAAYCERIEVGSRVADEQ